MRITINPYNPASVTAAIKLITQYKDDFLAKESEFVRRLAEIGVSVAGAGFASADYDGVNDVGVHVELRGTSAAVIAEGETVSFIEFGTGVRYQEWNPSGASYTPPAHGTYGKGRGANPKGWYFKQSEGATARHTYGNPPAEAMLTARNMIIERVVQIAREVWK